MSKQSEHGGVPPQNVEINKEIYFLNSVYRTFGVFLQYITKKKEQCIFRYNYVLHILCYCWLYRHIITIAVYEYVSGRVSSVGIARLATGWKVRWGGRDFSHMSRPAVGTMGTASLSRG